jgi:hypothetical protein
MSSYTIHTASGSAARALCPSPANTLPNTYIYNMHLTNHSKHIYNTYLYLQAAASDSGARALCRSLPTRRCAKLYFCFTCALLLLYCYYCTSTLSLTTYTQGAVLLVGSPNDGVTYLLRLSSISSPTDASVTCELIRTLRPADSQVR